MLEANLVRLIILDILSTDEYDMQRVANYTDTHVDIVQETCVGTNANPSATFLRRAIELHRTVRRDLYQNIMKKITAEYLPAT